LFTLSKKSSKEANNAKKSYNKQQSDQGTSSNTSNAYNGGDNSSSNSDSNSKSSVSTLYKQLESEQNPQTQQKIKQNIALENHKTQQVQQQSQSNQISQSEYSSNEENYKKYSVTSSDGKTRTFDSKEHAEEFIERTKNGYKKYSVTTSSNDTLVNQKTRTFKDKEHAEEFIERTNGNYKNKNLENYDGIGYFDNQKNQSIKESNPSVQENNNQRATRYSNNHNKNKNQNNNLQDLGDGMYAPIHNIGIDISHIPKNIDKISKGKKNEISNEYDNWQNGIEYKSTALDNTISTALGEDVKWGKSPAYYFGSAITDAGMFLSPIPIGKGVIGAKVGFQVSKNLSKAQKIANASREKNIIQNVDRMSKGEIKVIDETLSTKKHKQVTTTIKEVTPNVMRIDRGTELNPAKITTTFVDFGKKGKTTNIHSMVDDMISGKKFTKDIEVYGDIDKINKIKLGLKQKKGSKNNFVSGRNFNLKDWQIIETAKQGNKIKEIGNLEKFSTADIIKLSDEFAQKPTFDKWGNFIYNNKNTPTTKPASSFTKVFQTEQQGFNSVYGSNIDGITLGSKKNLGSKNFGKALKRLGLSEKEQNGEKFNKIKDWGWYKEFDVFEDVYATSQKSATKNSNKNTDKIKDVITKEYKDTYKKNQSKQTDDIMKMAIGIDSFETMYQPQNNKSPKPQNNFSNFGVSNIQNNIDYQIWNMPKIDVMVGQIPSIDTMIDTSIGTKLKNPQKTKTSQKQNMDIFQITDVMVDTKIKTGTIPKFDFDVSTQQKTKTVQKTKQRTKTRTSNKPPLDPIVEEIPPIIPLPPIFKFDVDFYSKSLTSKQTNYKVKKRGWVVPDIPLVEFGLGEFYESWDNSAYTKASRRSAGKKATTSKKKKKKKNNNWFEW